MLIKPEVNVTINAPIKINIPIEVNVPIEITNNFDFGGPTPIAPIPDPPSLPPGPSPAPTPIPQPPAENPEPPVDNCGQLKKCLDEATKKSPITYLLVTVTTPPVGVPQKVFEAPFSQPKTWVYIAGYAVWTRGGVPIGEWVKIRSLQTYIPKPVGANGFKAYSIYNAQFAIRTVTFSPDS